MANLTIKQFMVAVPGTTETFVRSLLQILYAHDEIKVYNKVHCKEEVSSGKNACPLILMQLYHFKINEVVLEDYFSLKFPDIFTTSNYSDSTLEKTFKRFDEFFRVYNNIEEYSFLTVEELLKHAIMMTLNNNPTVDNTIKSSLHDSEELFKRLDKEIYIRKNKYRNDYIDKIYHELSPQSIKYIDTASRIAGLIENEKISSDEIRTLSYLLSFYYCENISEYKRVYDEQKLIIDYLNKKGINLGTIKEMYGIEINKDLLQNIDPLVYYKRYFTNNFIKSSSYCWTLGYLAKDFFNKCIDNSLDKSLFTIFNINVTSLGNFDKKLDKTFYEKQGKTESEIYSNLPLATKLAIHRINRIYTYLMINRDKLNQDLVTGKNSLKALAVLLGMYDYDCELREYLLDNGITLDKILELINIGSKEEFIKTIDNFEEYSPLVTRLYSIFYGNNNATKSRNDMTPDILFNNLKNSEYLGSSIIQSLFSTIKGRSLPKDFSGELNKYISSKRQAKENELSEKVLKNVSINVCEYLKRVSSLYQNFDKSSKLSDPDKEQLAIIIGAMEYDYEINDYFELLGIDIEFLCKSFGIGDGFTSYRFKVEPISGPLKKYIFDRDEKDITVYSILENAFKKELTNTLALRSALFKVGLEPDHFKNFEKLIKDFKTKQEIEQKESMVNTLYNSISNEFNKTFTDILKIYERLTSINNKDDRRTLAIIVGLFINNDEHAKYFINNDITLDIVMFYYNIDKKIIDGLKDYQYNRDTILEFDDFIESKTNVESDDLIYDVFNECDTKVTENLAEYVNTPHHILKYEVVYKKEKEITPEQGMKMLSRVDVGPLEDLSILSITEYGQGLTNHFKFINNSLKDLVFNDSLGDSVTSVDELLSGIVVQEIIPKKTSLFGFLFPDTPTEKIEHKYNPDKIPEINEIIDGYLVTLSKELKGYDYIKKYVELYLKKLEEYLEYLKRLKESVVVPTQDISSIDDIINYTKALNQRSVKEIIDGKISNFGTMLELMKQELLTVHQAIINHFITINSLELSRSAILPILATQIAIINGNKTEEKAIALSDNLISLLHSVINRNYDLALANLEQLKTTTLSDETLKILNDQVTGYLKTATSSQELLDKIDDNDQKLKRC